MTIGSTVDSDPGPYLIDDTPTYDDTNMDDEDTSMGSQYYDPIMDGLCEGTLSGDIDIYDIMINDTHAIIFQGGDSKHLSKIWRIHLCDSKRNMDVTTQMSVWYQDPKIIHKYGTNDLMIQYKPIQ